MDGHYVAGLVEGVLLGGMAFAGIGAIRGGWVPGRERARVIRPRLWGQGMLVIAASLALAVLSLALFGGTVYWFLADLVGLAGLVTGAALMNRARQDRRRGAATPRAS